MRNISIRLAILLGLSCSISPAFAAEHVPVKGDKGLLEYVYAAQLTNKLKYEQGRLKAIVDSFRGGDFPARMHVEATLLWKKDACHWSYSYKNTLTQGTAIQDGCQQIETPSMLAMYSPQGKRIALSKPAEKAVSYPDEFRLRPDQQWFRLTGGKREWSELLDPAAGATPAGPAKEFTVAMEGDDRIVIERHYASGVVLRIVTSLAADANIVEYESNYGEQWHHGTYDWQRHAGGLLYLRKHERETTYVGNRHMPEITFKMEVTEFDPEAEVPQNRFELSSFDAPPDAILEEIQANGARTKRRLGGGALRDLQKELNAAAQKVREGKFAAPR